MNLKKVAVFGKPGGGKSTISKAISEIVGLPLYQLDSIQYEEGGIKVADDVFEQRHAKILESSSWVLDGLGPIESFRQRISEADTLVYIDLPMYLNFWWVTKRLLKSPFVYPAGWPKGSPLLKSTFASWRNLYFSKRFWTPEFRQKMVDLRSSKEVYIISSPTEISQFLNEIQIKKAGENL